MGKHNLRLAVSSPDFFGHNRDGSVENGQAYGCTCRHCGRETQAPITMQGAQVWCLYCGMKEGFVPMVEIQMGLEFTFGQTLDECRMVRKWCDDPNTDLDKMLYERAERLGHVLFTIGY